MNKISALITSSEDSAAQHKATWRERRRDAQRHFYTCMLIMSFYFFWYSFLLIVQIYNNFTTEGACMKVISTNDVKILAMYVIALRI